MQLTDPQKDYKTAGKKGTRNAHHCWHCITFFTMILSQNQLAQHQNARGLRRCEATCNMTPYDSYHKYPSKAHKAWRLHDTFVSCGTCIATCLRWSRTPTCLFSQMETLHPVLFCTQYVIQQCVTICYTICIQHLQISNTSRIHHLVYHQRVCKTCISRQVCKPSDAQSSTGSTDMCCPGHSLKGPIAT